MDLPDATKVSFIEATGVNITSLLPNLPSDDPGASNECATHIPPNKISPHASDLIHRFLVYPQSRRLSAADGMKHPWFTTGDPLLLPSSIRDVPYF